MIKNRSFLSVVVLFASLGMSLAEDKPGEKITFSPADVSELPEEEMQFFQNDATGIFLSEGLKMTYDELGLSAGNATTSHRGEKFRYFSVPESTGNIGIAMPTLGDGDDTFICCWHLEAPQ